MEAQSQVITLSSTIGKLKAVRRLVLFDSFLVRIPPEMERDRTYPTDSNRVFTICRWLRTQDLLAELYRRQGRLADARRVDAPENLKFRP